MSEASMTVKKAGALCERFMGHGVRAVLFIPFEHQADREDANSANATGHRSQRADGAEKAELPREVELEPVDTNGARAARLTS